ncbi:MAG: molecular chaperone HtpG [Leptospiraceae bacterium]|nr:molecular chaperone HtpG [Leptospiraceae bacterium]MDW7976617.1 molecular chaperone HtpG [Leptospiraceae bacterium]
METSYEKGKIGIHTENLLPIIKKWLYSEKEIFIRELISNAYDAIEKLKKVMMYENIYQPDKLDFAIEVKFDKLKKTLHFIDNGIGMTKEEVEKYIAQIAFSGAQEFAQKYLKDQSSVDFIGHFGLGFYSSFIVSKKVEIQTRSYREDAEPVYWASEGNDEYLIGKGTREDRGTEVILHLDDDAADEYLDNVKLQNYIRRYCDFFSVPIKLEGLQVNYQKPLWLKKPIETQKEEYISFYKYLYPFDEQPLFYIHLNTDYPFRLQGILYFPKIRHEMDWNQNNVKIFCKQVFVTDEAQEIIPKFLVALKGVLDLPELPLNVSRSYIQQDPEVKKISSHIVKKVADRIVEECKQRREEYEKIWKDISLFVKYGMLEDAKFYEDAKEALLFEVISSENLDKRTYKTLKEYQDKNKEKTENKIYYATDLKSQGPAIRLLLKQGIEVIYLDRLMDAHFMSFLELKESNIHFVRVDSEVSQHAIDNETRLFDQDQKTNKDRVEDLFRKALNNTKIIVRAESLKTEEFPAMIILPETYRRVNELAFLYGEKDRFTIPENHTLLLNLKNPLIQYLSKPDLITVDGNEINPKKLELAKQIYNLTRISQALVSPEEMQSFAKELFSFIEKNFK